MDSSLVDTVHLEQVRDEHGVLICQPLTIRGNVPCGGEALPLEDAELDLRVADIGC